MKVARTLVFLTVVFLFAFSPPKLSDLETRALQSIRESTLESHVRFLADDYLEGRASGTRGNEIAARYIAAHFQRLGLKPAGENGTYFQTVRLVERTVGSESRLRIAGSSLTSGIDFYSLGGAAELTGELLYTRFAITAPEYEYDDFKGIDVKGKIVVFLSGEPVSEDSSYFLGGADSPHASFWRKYRKIESMGAAAVIQVLLPSDDKKFREYESWYSHPQAALASTEQKSSSFMRVLLTPAGSEKFLSLFNLTRNEIAANPASGDRIQKAKPAATLNVIVKERYFTSPNVLGMIEGSDPKLKDETVILTAHFDHVGIGTPVDGDSIYNGLSDNASGTAALMAAAEAFALLNGKTKRSVAFLACTAEEMGLLGSRYFTEQPTIPIQNIVANVNMDVLGVANEKSKKTMTFIGEEFTSLGPTMRTWADYLGVKVYPDLFPEERFFYRSDNLNFHMKKIPSISPASGMTDRSDFDEYLKYYHKPSDEWGKLPMIMEALRIQAQVIFLSSLDIANAVNRPTFKQPQP